jgi:hypothetical protein
MIELDGIKYITDKEASARYGKSISWFQRQRHKKLPPPFVKLQGKGTVYYCLNELDQWFKDNFLVYK